MVITTKIKELQYYTKFNEVFVLSLLILAVNLAAKGLFHYIATGQAENKSKKDGAPSGDLQIGGLNSYN